MAELNQPNRSRNHRLHDGRLLCYAEYGDPSGRSVFVFHGTLGSRVLARVLQVEAASAGVRLIGPDRPGYGGSSPWTGCLSDYPDDVVQLADALGIQKFGVLGISGGGPYALSCAWRIPDRLMVAGLLSSIGPLYLTDATRDMPRGNRWILSSGKYSPALTGILLQLLTRFSLFVMRSHLRNGTSPSPDIPPDVLALVMDDQRTAFQTGRQGIAFDMRTLWRPWLFRLEDIVFPVIRWHGAADSFAPTSLSRFMVEHLPNCHATFYPGEGHQQPLLRHQAEVLAALKAAAHDDRAARSRPAPDVEGSSLPN